MKKITVPLNMQLRQVNDSDHSFLVELRNDPIVLRNLTHPNPITMSHHLKWWEKISQDPKQLRLIFTINGHRAGFTKFYDIDRFNQNCVLGADLYESYRGLGFAKYMWTLMLERCFVIENLHRVALSTAVYNVIGHRVYKNLGFKNEGIQPEALFREGKYWDLHLMYMLKRDWEQCHA